MSGPGKPGGKHFLKTLSLLHILRDDFSRKILKKCQYLEKRPNGVKIKMFSLEQIKKNSEKLRAKVEKNQFFN